MSPEAVLEYFHSMHHEHTFVVRIAGDIRARGGEVVGVCSQSQAEADRAREKWSVNFPLVGDPGCGLAEMLNEKGWIESVVDTDMATKAEGVALIGYQYEKGMLQPGTVALQGPTDDADAEPTVLLTWGSIPTKENINGAIGRLSPELAWRGIQKSLGGDFSEARPSPGVMGKTLPFPLPVLYALVIANGNFVYAKPLLNGPEGSLSKATALSVLVKLLAAVGLSVWFFARRPVEVLAALGLWGFYYYIVIRPKLVRFWKM